MVMIATLTPDPSPKGEGSNFIPSSPALLPEGEGSAFLPSPACGRGAGGEGRGRGAGGEGP